MPPLYINIGSAPELRGVRMDAYGTTFGPLTTITEFQTQMSSSYPALAESIKRVASAPICNLGTVVGNLMMANAHASPATFFGSEGGLRHVEAGQRLRARRGRTGFGAKHGWPGDCLLSHAHRSRDVLLFESGRVRSEIFTLEAARVARS